MTDNEKLERVIKGMECCSREDIGDCNNCPYNINDMHCDIGMMRDALELLKSQEPRVMTWEEAQATVNEGPFIVFEVRDSTGSEVDFGVLVGDFYEMSEGSVLTVADFWMMKDDYGKRFRLWTSRPTEAEREAVKWE